MEKTFELLPLEKLMSAIGIIGRQAAKTEAMIQYAAVQCIAQSIVHRNSTPAAELIKNMPKGARIDSLVAYLEKFGNLAYRKNEKTVVFFDVEKHGGKKLDWTQIYSVEVEAFMWTKGTKPAVIVSAYDFDEELSKFIGIWTKRAADTSKSVEHKDLLADIQVAYNAYVVKTHGHTEGVDASDIAGDAENTRKIQKLVEAKTLRENAVAELLANAEIAALITEQVEEPELLAA